ncbi:MAG TPA: hypothetical protein VNY52_07125 [Solirubrobacteraceae bacterium]|nr:hypothetical protein [Solirubrobacteraceae bacterium]
MIGIIGLAVGGLLTGGFSLLQSRLAVREREQARRQQNLMAAFQYFDGGTQRRSIGISIIEAYQRTMPELLPMFIPLLANQAVYLLTRSKQSEGVEHEDRNLERIMDLLGEAKPSGEFADRYDDLAEVLEQKTAGSYPLGLKLSPERLAKYRRRVESKPG